MTEFLTAAVRKLKRKVFWYHLRKRQLFRCSKILS